MTRTAMPPAGPNPWTRRSTDERYANPWIRVREDRVRRPDGADGIYGVVEVRNLALGAVPLFADGTTLLVGQHRYPLDAYSWEIPEGGGDPALDPLEEVARELAEDLTEGDSAPEGTEVLRIWRLPFADALALALEGELTDSLTVAGVVRAAHVMDRRAG